MSKIYCFLLATALTQPVAGNIQKINNVTTPQVSRATTSVADQLTLKNIYDNRTTGKYGNFSWDPNEINSITSSQLEVKYWGTTYHCLRLIWTKPADMAYPTKLKYGYTIAAGENSDSASKAYNDDETNKPYMPMGGDGTKQYTVTESTLYSNYNKIVVWFSHSYMADELKITGITFQIMTTTYTVQATKGTGVKSVYVSSDQNATSGNTSGSFGKGTKVYSFAKLDKGYNAKSNWTLVSGTANSEDAIYRTGSYTVGTSDYNFGTINASIKSKAITLNRNGGGSSTVAVLTYGEGYTLPSPTRTGYDFLGWNTKQDGSGDTYTSFTADQVNEIIAGTLDTLYAQWERLGTAITLDKQGGTGGDSMVFGINGEEMPNATMPTRPGYIFEGYFTEKNGQGVKFYSADGSSATNWDKEDETFTLYANWTMKAVVANAINAINQIEDPVVLTTECENHIINARTTYELVDEEDRSAVTNYQVLTAAEARLQVLKEAKADAEDVEDLIDAIGEVDYFDSKAAIKAARDAYNALTADGKGFVGNYQTLLDAEAAYEDQKQDTVNNAKNAIDAIGTVTLDSEQAIIAARDAYNLVETDDKPLVTNYETLTAAEARLQELKEAKAAAEDVEDLIDLIGEVSYYESKAAIKAARDAYNALTADGKSFVGNYQTLLDAEGRYAELQEETIKNAIDAIAAIPNPAFYTQNTLDKLDAAKEAMNLVDEDDFDLITNRQRYFDACSEYGQMRSQAIEKAIYYINNVKVMGTVQYNDEFRVAIENARAAYDALLENDPSAVTNYQYLLDAEAAYEAKKNEGANSVINLINAIGTVTLDKEDEINEAKEAYNALSNDQKELVTNYQDLLDAEARLDELKAAKEKADEVVSKIDAIGEVIYPDSKDLIDEARNAYDALSNDDERGFVTNYQDLLDAEEQYNALRQHDVDAVEGLINAIGIVTLDKEDAINEAREAYNNLNDEQKELVINYETLTAAEDRLQELKDAKAEAEDVDALINAIGEVTYPESKELIDAAREAYDALSDDAKGFVTDLQKLLDAEEAFENGKINGANEVKDLINNIGKVEHTAESKAKIDAAREAYNALTAEQKELVSNYNNLLEAEKTYKNADETIAKIDAIGKVTLDSKEAIQEARAAYNALTEEEKALVSNYDKLTHAETTYQNAQEVIAKIDAIGDVSLDSGKAIEQATEAYDALTEEEKALLPTYHDNLVEKTQTYNKIVHDHEVGTTCGIVFGVIADVLIFLVGLWLIFMFIHNKWVVVNGKVVRGFRLLGIKKNGKYVVCAFPFRFVTKDKEEIFTSKEDALK